MDGLLERVCWIAAYCASLAGQRASEGKYLGDGCYRTISDGEAAGQAMADAHMAVASLRGVK